MADPSKFQYFATKPRVVILSDISNEPDDAESLVRYLLYSNQFSTEGIVACTSTWMKNKTCPQDMEKIIRAYEEAVDNLNAHAHPDMQYPSAEHLLSLIRSGPPVYGMAAVGKDIPLSPGAELLLERITANVGNNEKEEGQEEAGEPAPLWILCWGGTNVLASTLLHIENSFPSEQAARLRSRMRVYAISDQDDTGAWIRNRYPDVLYIASVHGWNMYGLAAWTGISGDNYYRFDQGGPDFSKLTKEWIKENIQIGPLGSAYPDYMFIPEGDTPTFLYLIQNGLGYPERPDYGSWGGRYILNDISGSGLASRHYSDAADVDVPGKNGGKFTSNHATIWRWRDAFQNDFAARMQWTLSPDVSAANHHPVISIGGDTSVKPIEIEAEAGSTITVDASGTYDPDVTNDKQQQKLTFKWFHYRDPTATQWWVDAEVAALEITPQNETGSVVSVTVPPAERSAVELMSRKPVAKGQLLHLILEVTDNGSPPLTSYRRVLIQVTNKDLRGGSGREGGGGGEVAGDMQSFA